MSLPAGSAPLRASAPSTFEEMGIPIASAPGRHGLQNNSAPQRPNIKGILSSMTSRLSRRPWGWGGKRSVSSAEPAIHGLQEQVVRATIDAGLGGMRRISGDQQQLDTTMEMLRKNDEVGLKAAATGNGPLRSFATALKACSDQLKGNSGVQALPKQAQEAIGQLQEFYTANPDLISLGNPDTFGNMKLTGEQADRLVSKFNEGLSLMSDLEKAMKQ
jgi:hypothetical protein